MCKIKHRYVRATETIECPQISSNIAGYIPNKFKLLTVDVDDSLQHVATVAELTLTMHLLTTPQLPLLADGAIDFVRFKIDDRLCRLCCSILI